MRASTLLAHFATQRGKAASGKGEGGSETQLSFGCVLVETFEVEVDGVAAFVGIIDLPQRPGQERAIRDIGVGDSPADSLHFTVFTRDASARFLNVSKPFVKEIRIVIKRFVVFPDLAALASIRNVFAALFQDHFDRAKFPKAISEAIRAFEDNAGPIPGMIFLDPSLLRLRKRYVCSMQVLRQPARVFVVIFLIVAHRKQGTVFSMRYHDIDVGARRE
jgi:hypothetical protein